MGAGFTVQVLPGATLGYVALLSTLDVLILSMLALVGRPDECCCGRDDHRGARGRGQPDGPADPHGRLRARRPQRQPARRRPSNETPGIPSRARPGAT